MFDWADDDGTSVTIARKLQKMGIPPCGEMRPGKRQKKVATKWMAHRVRDILRNPIYKGKHTYRAPADPYRNLPAEEITRDVPALVSVEQWERVQAKLTRNGILAMNKPKYPYLLRGLLHCGHRLPNGEICGYSYSGITTVLKSGQTQYYRCNARFQYEAVGKERKDRCTSRQLRADILERAVREDIATFLAKPGDVIEKLEAQQQTAADEKETTKEIRRLEGLLSHQSEERNAVMRMHRRGAYTDEQCEAQLSEIQQEAIEYQKELADLRQKAVDAESVARDLRTARSLLDEKAGALYEAQHTSGKRSFSLWREIIEALVDGITVLEPDAQGRPRVRVTYRFEPHFQRFVGRSGKEFMQDLPATASPGPLASPVENGNSQHLTVGDSARRSRSSATPRTRSCACTAAR
jgi:site-specific DNA recombinase